MLELITNQSFLAIGALVIVLSIYVCGDITSKLAEKKGYMGSRYFSLGFFLGIVGLLYVAGLPESEEHLRRRIVYITDSTVSEEVIEQPRILEVKQEEIEQLNEKTG